MSKNVYPEFYRRRSLYCYRNDEVLVEEKGCLMLQLFEIKCIADYKS